MRRTAFVRMRQCHAAMGLDMSDAVNPLHGVAPTRAHTWVRRPFNFWSGTRRFSTIDSGVPLEISSLRGVEAAVSRVFAVPTAPPDRSWIAGALPFDEARAPKLRSYASVKHAEAQRVRAKLQETVDARAIVEEPSAEHYMHAVERAVSRIQAGDLQKVVLSRSLLISLARPIDLEALLTRIAEQNPGKYIFRCDVAGLEQPARTLIGASPELLVSKQGSNVVSHPLAGSSPRYADAAEDRASAARLLQSEKNLREHALVVEAVADALTPHCRELHVPSAPALVSTKTMWHLGTRVTGELCDPEMSSLLLALALHPTPAVCGVPAHKAHEYIRTLEGFDRDYFAGCVGYCDAHGNGEWAVTIRCAEITEHSARVYAGAGIVADSKSHDELAETSAKLRTMLQALGLDPEREDA